MKKIILIILISLFLLGCQTQPTGIEGTWEGPMINQNSFSWDVELELKYVDGNLQGTMTKISPGWSQKKQAHVKMTERYRIKNVNLTEKNIKFTADEQEYNFRVLTQQGPIQKLIGDMPDKPGLQVVLRRFV